MKWGGGKKRMENTVDMTCNQNSGLLTRSHTVNTALPFFPLFFLSSQQPGAVAYTHPTTVASYTVHQAPVAAHTVAAAYAPTAATVAVARPAPVAVAAAATAAAYGGYQPAHATADYGYAQRQPDVPPPPPPVTSQNYQVGYQVTNYPTYCFNSTRCFVCS